MKVKICGLTRLEDASLAVELGADYLGFIFYPPSPRYMKPKQVKEILAVLPAGTYRSVGVFVNASLQDIQDIKAQSGIDMVQLHGEERPSFVAELDPDSVIKVLRAQSTSDMDIWLKQPYLLIDGDAREEYGGRGVQANWAVAAQCKTVYNGILLLAGGLTQDNVLLAMERVQPDGVDVSSGVESAPGIKDPQKMSQFINRAKRSE